MNKRYMDFRDWRLPRLLCQGNPSSEVVRGYMLRVAFSADRITSVRLKIPGEFAKSTLAEDKVLEGLELRPDCFLADPVFHGFDTKDAAPGPIAAGFHFRSDCLDSELQGSVDETPVNDRIEWHRVGKWEPKKFGSGSFWELLKFAVDFLTRNYYLSNYESACVDIGLSLDSEEATLEEEGSDLIPRMGVCKRK
ncbi:hypothetical protein ABW21_db0203409 [Orbilia brochopaga]|nr:hypothetical protein ABW21_db0203409 [Drechslerella brochopaga]